MALNPIRFLVMPRVLATTLSLICLAILADVTAVIGGGIIGVTALDIAFEVYRDNTINQLKQADFLTGLLKAGVFGAILGLIACRNGLRVEGGAAGVGKATTDTVVQTVVVVVLADLLFTAIFYAIGWT
jgi:phospholipid/cholesterol/gamma-HCH transport system permease protein